MMVDVAGVGVRACCASLTAEALVPVLIVGFIGASAASLEGFAMNGRDFRFSMADSPSFARQFPVVLMLWA